MRLSIGVLKSLAAKVSKNESTIRWLDLYVAQHICDEELARSGEDCTKEKISALAALGCLVSYMGSQGKTSLNLDGLEKYTQLGIPLDCIKALQDLALLRSCMVIQQEGVASQFDQPLVYEAGTVYLRRHWLLERELNEWMQSRLTSPVHVSKAEIAHLATLVSHIFGSLDESSDDNQEIDWQRMAAAYALLCSFTIVTGGPGTGKTTTAARMLCLLMAQFQLRNKEELEGLPAVPKVRLLAPTGKAALRLSQAISEQFTLLEQQSNLAVSAKQLLIQARQVLPGSGTTIHRFLHEHGALNDARFASTYADSDAILLAHKRQNDTATVDIVLVDESSMIDIELMAALLRVLPDSAHIVFMGDHNQLPPVEPGQVFATWVQRFAELPQSPASTASLSSLCSYSERQIVSQLGASVAPQNVSATKVRHNPLCQLRKTYRFDGELKQLSQLVLSDSYETLHRFLSTREDTVDAVVLAGERNLAKSEARRRNSDRELKDHCVSWFAVDQNTIRRPEIRSCVALGYQAYFEKLTANALLSELLAEFERYQLICSTREGPAGVEVLNRYIEQHFGFHSEIYHGKAVMVSRNHFSLGVFNGDVGFIMEQPEKPGGKTFFEVHFANSEGDVKVIPLYRLSALVPAYATTVHKSQGSEFAKLDIVLADYAPELLSRALLYTAITRAKSSCRLWASSSALEILMTNP